MQRFTLSREGPWSSRLSSHFFDNTFAFAVRSVVWWKFWRSRRSWDDVKARWRKDQRVGRTDVCCRLSHDVETYARSSGHTDIHAPFMPRNDFNPFAESPGFRWARRCWISKDATACWIRGREGSTIHWVATYRQARITSMLTASNRSTVPRPIWVLCSLVGVRKPYGAMPSCALRKG